MTFNFEVKRELTAEVIAYGGEHYMRTREVAQLIGVKQQYEFNADIKRSIGVKAILKGEDTRDFRGQDDDKRTTFINIKKLIVFLQCGEINHKMIQSKKEEVCDGLIRILVNTRCEARKNAM